MNRRDFLNLAGLGAAGVVLPRVPGLAQVAGSALHSPVHFKHFNGRSGYYLMRSKAFRTYVEGQFPKVKAEFFGNQPLWHALWSCSDNWGKVTVEHNRFVHLHGFMNHVASTRSLLWMDATRVRAGAAPLVVAAFRSDLGPAQLSVFASQPLFESVTNPPPHNLVLNIRRWIRINTKKQDGGPVRTVAFYTPGGADEQPPTLEGLGIPAYRTVRDVPVHVAKLV